MAKKKKKGIKEEIRKQREQELHTFVYENEESLSIKQFEKYHFRIFKGNRHIDVWPVTRKYWATWFTNSKVYAEIGELLEAFSEAPKTK